MLLRMNWFVLFIGVVAWSRQVVATCPALGSIPDAMYVEVDMWSFYSTVRFMSNGAEYATFVANPWSNFPGIQHFGYIGNQSDSFGFLQEAVSPFDYGSSVMDCDNKGIGEVHWHWDIKSLFQSYPVYKLLDSTWEMTARSDAATSTGSLGSGGLMIVIKDQYDETLFIAEGSPSWIFGRSYSWSVRTETFNSLETASALSILDKASNSIDPRIMAIFIAFIVSSGHLYGPVVGIVIDVVIFCLIFCSCFGLICSRTRNKPDQEGRQLLPTKDPEEEKKAELQKRSFFACCSAGKAPPPGANAMSKAPPSTKR